MLASLMEKKKTGVVVIGIVGLLLVIYLGMSVFFEVHFFPGTSVDGMNVSAKSVKGIQRKIDSKVDEYSLKIIEKDGNTDTILGKEIGLVTNWDDSLSEMLKAQNGFTWPAHIFKKQQYDGCTLLTFDEDKLKEQIDRLNCLLRTDVEKAENAYISDYKDGYEIVAETKGTEIDKDKLFDAISLKITAMEEELNLWDEDAYASAEYTSESKEIVDLCNILNSYANSVINYQVGDDKFSLDVNTFKDWIKVNDDLTVDFDNEAIAEYVSGLAKKYNTCYSAKKLMTSYEKEVTITLSHYGWKVDNEAEAAAIIEDIKSGEEVTRDLNYSMTANSHTGNDYGDSYVEINLSAQHLFLYKEGKLVLESDFVSGNISQNNGTPTGAFGITYCEKDATLRGDNYSTPVAYWMPFNGNVGMHDATWRSSFGGAIYVRNGSHGCINLPKSVAEQIFANVEKNYPVLVYELEGTESDAAKAQIQANAVIDKIKAIGEVSLKSKKNINKARKAYDELSDAAKAYVNNYQTLEDAEKKLEKLEKKKAKKKAQKSEAESEVEEDAVEDAE